MIRQLIAPLLRPLQKTLRLRDHRSSPTPIDGLPPHDVRAIAQQLCRTLDRVVELGLWEHAQRIAGTAARIAQQSPQLTERLARLALLRDDSEAALAILEACPARTPLMGMLRILCMIRTSRYNDAHIEIYRWTRRPGPTPPWVRVLLALLEWQAGDTSAAIAALLNEVQENQQTDSQVLALLVATCTAAGRNDQARTWSRKLRTMTETDQSSDRPTHHVHMGWLPDLSAPSEELAGSWLSATVENLITDAVRQGLGLTKPTGRRSTELEVKSPDPATLRFPPSLEGQISGSRGVGHRQAA